MKILCYLPPLETRLSGFVEDEHEQTDKKFVFEVIKAIQLCFCKSSIKATQRIQFSFLSCLPHIVFPAGHVHTDGSLRGVGSFHAAHTHPCRTDPWHQTHPGCSGGDLQVTPTCPGRLHIPAAKIRLQAHDWTRLSASKATFLQVAHTHRLQWRLKCTFGSMKPLLLGMPGDWRS